MPRSMMFCSSRMFPGQEYSTNQFHGFLRDRLHCLSDPLRRLFEKGHYHLWNVGSALPQCRHTQWYDLQAVVEIRVCKEC